MSKHPCPAYLIDPEAKTVTEVTYDGDFRSIYRLIGAEAFDAARFDEEGDTVFVDDEGLFKPYEYFMIQGYSQPLAGKGLVLGSDEEGDSVKPRLTLEVVKAKVEFGLLGRIPKGLIWMPDNGQARLLDNI